MIYEYISLLFGIFKIVLYKILNFNKIKFESIPMMNCNFKIAMKKGTKMIVGKKLRTRNNVSFRIYNKGIVNIGNNCFFNDGCSINCQQNIKIGDNVIMGQNVMIFDHDHDYRNNINDFVRNDVVIGNNVWIGANVVILKGVIIGDNTVIAAGSIVNKDIPSNKMFYQKKINEKKNLI